MTLAALIGEQDLLAVLEREPFAHGRAARGTDARRRAPAPPPRASIAIEGRAAATTR
jgi:hypothetical protein